MHSHFVLIVGGINTYRFTFLKRKANSNFLPVDHCTQF